MSGASSILAKVREAAAIKYLFTPHAVQQMNRPHRLISSMEVKSVVENGRIIEDYPEDARGHSCLMLGNGENGRPIHAVCSPKEEYLAIITVYQPNPDKWNENFDARKPK